MDWIQILAENPFLIFSILSGTFAAAILVGAILNSKQKNDLQAASESQNKLSTMLDRITLLNRNLIQCPRCFRMDFANIRFCSGCGTRMVPHTESLGNAPFDIETHYAIQGSTRLVGISLKPDARTSIGVIIGLDNNELQKKKTDLLPVN